MQDYGSGKEWKLVNFDALDDFTYVLDVGSKTKSAFCCIQYHPLDMELIDHLDKERHEGNIIPWRQNISWRKHWGISLPNKHISYLLTSDEHYFNTYVSGYDKEHEGEAVA